MCQSPRFRIHAMAPVLAIAAALFQTPSPAQTLKRVYHFQNELPSPNGGLTLGPGGVLYGTTYDGGAAGAGTVFMLTPPASAGSAWTETTIYEFGTTGPANPVSGVTMGSGGVLYGTTFAGGIQGQGTVYALTPPAVPGGAWTEATLHEFDNTTVKDGERPWSGVTIGPQGQLYGATPAGDVGETGLVYELSPPASPGGVWTETLIYLPAGFGSPENFYGGVVAGSNGVLYGTACGIEQNFGGAVFSLVPPASPGGAWTEFTLHEFTANGDGNCPHTTLAMDSKGVLYGTTFYGGTSTACFNGCGTVFSITPLSSGESGTEAVLYDFTGGSDGANPLARLSVGANGELYGTTEGGGNPVGGTIFSLAPPAKQGGAWSYKLLYAFNGSTNGDWPSPLLLYRGQLYGTTYASPSSVFALHP